MGMPIPPARAFAAACALAALTCTSACRRQRSAPSTDGETGVVEWPAGRGAIDAHRSPVLAPEVPEAAAVPPCEPDLAVVGCAGWVSSVTATGCLLVWSDCSDHQVREVRCEQQGDHQTCHCVLTGSQISSFESPTFCAPGGQSPSVDRARYTEAVRAQCGWRLGSRAPTPAR
jgi:hypothetical protein